MAIGVAQRVLGLVCLAALLVVPGATSATEKPRKGRAVQAQAAQQNALIVARVSMDGVACPTGMARLRPWRAGQIDTSRFVSIGYVTLYDSRPGMQAMVESMAKFVTLDISGFMKEAGSKELLERFVPIDPGTYVITGVTCRAGRGVTQLGGDHANAFAVEAGIAIPVKGANLIDVRAGEILDAGIIEIRSDPAGFFERKTGSLVAGVAPATDQAALREAFRAAGNKLRFGAFRPGPGAR